MFKPHNFIAKHAETFTNFVVVFPAFSYKYKKIKKDSRFLVHFVLGIVGTVFGLFDFIWKVFGAKHTKIEGSEKQNVNCSCNFGENKMYSNWKPKTCHHNYFPNLCIHVGEICCCCCCCEKKWNKMDLSSLKHPVCLFDCVIHS